MNYNENKLQRKVKKKDVHNCPRVVGPATNYFFRKMLPMHKFMEKVNDNNRAWLRIYETDKEKQRLKNKVDFPATEAQIRGCNQEWPFFIK